VKPDATHARLASSATDRPIDGVDQSDVLFGNSAAGHRESMLSLIGPQLIAVRRKQWRFYLTDMHPTGSGPQRLTGTMAANSAMGVYPKVYNIEMDPHEDLNVIGLFPMVMVPALAAVRVERDAEPLFRHGGPAIEPRHAPILATIPPPAQYAVTFFVGVGCDRLM
jgi:hypothetical protein